MHFFKEQLNRSRDHATYKQRDFDLNIHLNMYAITIMIVKMLIIYL